MFHAGDGFPELLFISNLECQSKNASLWEPIFLTLISSRLGYSTSFLLLSSFHILTATELSPVMGGNTSDRVCGRWGTCRYCGGREWNFEEINWICYSIWKQASTTTGFPRTLVLESCCSGVVSAVVNAHKAALWRGDRSRKCLCFVTPACGRIAFTRCLTAL